MSRQLLCFAACLLLLVSVVNTSSAQQTIADVEAKLYAPTGDGMFHGSAVGETLPTPTSRPDLDVIQGPEPEQWMQGVQTNGLSEGLAVDCCPPDFGTRPCWIGPRISASAEFLYWWNSGMEVPPLVTTSPTGTAQADAGVLGESTTSVLFGDGNINTSGAEGGRFTLSYWLTPSMGNGIETTYMMLGQQTSTFSESESDHAILARPFYDVVGADQDASLIAYPGFLSGTLGVTAKTDFQGVNVVYTEAIRRTCHSQLDFLLGYRWTQMEDGLLFQENSLVLSGPAINSTYDVFDRFDTRNNFHGVDLGLRYRRQLRPCWSFELLGKVAIGNMNSTVDIDGQTIVTDAGAVSTTSAGGLLALPTNMGHYEDSQIAAVTEVGVLLRRQFRRGLELKVGYTFLHISDVARAGAQIDTGVNTSQVQGGALVGAARPAFNFETTGFFTHGLNIGLHCDF